MQSTTHLQLWHFPPLKPGLLVNRRVPFRLQRLEALLHEETAADAQESVVLHVHGRVPHGKDGVPDVLDKCAIAANATGGSVYLSRF